MVDGLHGTKLGDLISSVIVHAVIHGEKKHVSTKEFNQAWDEAFGFPCLAHDFKWRQTPELWTPEDARRAVLTSLLN